MYPKTHNQKKLFIALIEQPAVIGLLFALIILTLGGTGSPVSIGITGIILCLIGLFQKTIKVDLWIFLPLLLYGIFSLISSYIAVNTPFSGYVYAQLICPIIYILATSLGEHDRTVLRSLSLLYAAIISAVGILQFLIEGFKDTANRLGGIFDNANVMGIFLVMSWFSLLMLKSQADSENSLYRSLLKHLEPIFMCGIALTLSMGSFVAMAIGILVLVIYKIHTNSFSDAAIFLAEILTRASIGIGSGLLIYIAATRTDSTLLLISVAICYIAVVVLWNRFEEYIHFNKLVSFFIVLLGLLVSLAVFIIRFTSIYTFIERIEMMKTGFGYMLGNPLTGVGPMRWHLMNMFDGDNYFNTWYIHDMFIHIGAELGVIAAILLLIVMVRSLIKQRQPETLAGIAALTFHYSIDVGFAYMGIAATAILLLGTPCGKEKFVGNPVAKSLFIFYAVLLILGLLKNMP